MERLVADHFVRKQSSMFSTLKLIAIFTLLNPLHVNSRNLKRRQIDESQFPLEGEVRPADSGAIRRDEEPHVGIGLQEDVIWRPQPLDITNIGQDPVWENDDQISNTPFGVGEESDIPLYEPPGPIDDQPVEYVQYEIYDDVMPPQLQSQLLTSRAKDSPVEPRKAKEIGERQTFIETKTLESCCCYIGSDAAEREKILKTPRHIVLEEGVMMGVIISTPFCFIPRPVDITCNFRVSVKNNDHGLSHHLKSEPEDGTKGTTDCGLKLVFFNTNGNEKETRTKCQSVTESLEPGKVDGGLGYKMEIKKGQAFNFDASFTLLGKVGQQEGRSAFSEQKSSRSTCTIKALPGQTKKCGNTNYCIPMAAECNGYNDCPAPNGQADPKDPAADEEEKESCPEVPDRNNQKELARSRRKERRKKSARSESESY